MSNNRRVSHILQQEVEKSIGKAVHQYMQMPPEKRQELEQNKVTLSKMVFDQIMPFVANLRISTLLVVMEEGIGNMIMLTPALKMLRNLNPRLKITVWGKEPAVQVLKDWDVIDSVITEFDNKYYDLCYLTVWSNNIKQRYAPVIKSHCKNVLESDLKMYHESIQNLAVADFLGGYGELATPYCSQATGNELMELHGLMNNNEGDMENYIVFGDTSLVAHGWDKKRWPHYQQLAKKIAKKFPEYKIVMIGDKNDLTLAEEKEWTDNVTLYFMGKVSILQLASLIKGAKMYIGNDTGPTHMAAALGTKTYAIFGPTRLSKNKPIGPDVTVLHKALPCSPCQYTERWDNCECLGFLTADDVYQSIFFPHENKRKKLLLVGSFSTSNVALTNEVYIKRTLEKDFNFRVIQFDYRQHIDKLKNGVDATYELVNTALETQPDEILICGGQMIVPGILTYLNSLMPKTKISVWYVDNRKNPEQWFYDISAVCHNSYWSTGDPNMLSKIFAQTQKPCEFVPITPDDKMYKPIDGIEKDIDVLFVGTPHSKDRVELLEYLNTNLDKNINFQIYGNGNWPPSLKSRVNAGVFNEDFNKLLNRSKIVINQNIINDVPLYFSDRYFYPQATKTVGLNYHIPQLEDMFEDGKHMVFWDNKEQLPDQIKELLNDPKKLELISNEGYKLYKDKYTLSSVLEQVVNK